MTQVKTFSAVRLPVNNNHKSTRNYLIGDLVHNKADDLAYRAITDHSGTIDLSSDSINWELAIELADTYLLYARTLDDSIDLVEILGYYEIGDGGKKKGKIITGFNVNGAGTPTQNKGSIHNISNNGNPVHFELIVDGSTINAHTFGIQGNQKNADRFRWRTLLNYASRNRLKVVTLPNQKYIVDNLGTINDPDYFVDIDFCGSTIKRFIDVKPLPLKKIPRVSLGTVATNVTKLNERELEQAVALNVNTNLGAELPKNIHYVEGDTQFDVLDSSTVSDGDYVTVKDDRSNKTVNAGLLHRLITDNTTSPMTFVEQTFNKASNTWRDRFFVANDDLSKRALIVGDINGAITSLNLLSNPTQIGPNGNLVTVHEFADGEELFLYIYESEQDVTYFDATTETITDIRLQSQYKKNGSNEWKTVRRTKPASGPVVYELDPADNVEVAALLLEEFDSFRMINYVYDGEREDKDSLALDVNVINNYSIWHGDQSYPLSWYKFIDFSFNTKGKVFEIRNFVHKNNTLSQVIGSGADIAIDRITVRDGVNEDTGGVRFTGKNVRVINTSKTSPPKFSELIVENIKDSNPYKIRARLGGVSSRGYQQTYYRNIYKTHDDSGINFGRGEDVVDVKDVFFTNPFSKQKDYEISPFFTGFIMPEYNGGAFNILSKFGDTGYERSSRYNIEGVKVNELFHHGNMIYDLDPVTGGFGMRQSTINILYTRNEDGAGNLSITNSDIIGSIQAIDPLSPGNASFQRAGGLNVNVTNCTFKTHLDIASPVIQAGRTGVIKDLTVIAIDPRELEQGKFYHVDSSGPRLSASQIIGVKDYVGITIDFIRFWRPNTLGFGQRVFGSNLPNDPSTYDTVSNNGIYDYGGGGEFTQRSPIPTELDDLGLKKVVSTFSDLQDPAFFASYKKGFIEVADEQIELAPGVSINRRYINPFNDIRDFFWRQENEGNDVPLQQFVFKDIQSPGVKVFQAANADSFVDSFAQFYFCNVSNLTIDSNIGLTLDGYSSKHGMSKFIFENVSIVEERPSSSLTSQSVTSDSYYHGSSQKNNDLISSGEAYPVLKIYRNCQFLSKNRKDGLLFREVNISNISADDASKITWLHPQFNKIALRRRVLDLSLLDFTHAFNNQMIEFMIDQRSILDSANSQRVQIIDGTETYDTPGIYRFYVDKVTNPNGELILSEIISLPA